MNDDDRQCSCGDEDCDFCGPDNAGGICGLTMFVWCVIAVICAVWVYKGMP